MNSLKITEQQNSNSLNIDKQSVEEILHTINNEDANIANSVKNAIPQISNFVDEVIKSFWNGGRLFYVGAGTSGRLGVLDASECPPTFRTHPQMVQGIIAGGDAALRNSVEGAEDDGDAGINAMENYSVKNQDVVLGISANGNAQFILSALKEAKLRGASTGLFMCNKPKKIDYIDHVISVLVGPEVVTGSTRMKAGTATKMVLNMITTTSMIKLNKTYGNLMVDLTACNKKLWDRGSRIVSQITNLNLEKSMELLKSADGEVKTAIAMWKLQCNKEHAQKELQNVNGSLSQIIDKS